MKAREFWIKFDESHVMVAYSEKPAFQNVELIKVKEVLPSDQVKEKLLEEAYELINASKIRFNLAGMRHFDLWDKCKDWLARYQEIANEK